MSDLTPAERDRIDAVYWENDDRLIAVYLLGIGDALTNPARAIELTTNVRVTMENQDWLAELLEVFARHPEHCDAVCAVAVHVLQDETRVVHWREQLGLSNPARARELTGGQEPSPTCVFCAATADVRSVWLVDIGDCTACPRCLAGHTLEASEGERIAAEQQAHRDAVNRRLYGPIRCAVCGQSDTGVLVWRDGKFVHPDSCPAPISEVSGHQMTEMHATFGPSPHVLSHYDAIEYGPPVSLEQRIVGASHAEGTE